MHIFLSWGRCPIFWLWTLKVGIWILYFCLLAADELNTLLVSFLMSITIIHIVRIHQVSQWQIQHVSSKLCLNRYSLSLSLYNGIHVHSRCISLDTRDFVIARHNNIFGCGSHVTGKKACSEMTRHIMYGMV
jgi:hypothetical protein